MGRVGARSSPPPGPQLPSPSITSLGKYLFPPFPPGSCLLLPVPSQLQSCRGWIQFSPPSGDLGISGLPTHFPLGSGSSEAFSSPLRVSPPSSCAISPSCLTSFLISFLSPSPPPSLGLSPWEPSFYPRSTLLTFSILSCHPSYFLFHLPPSCFTSSSPSFSLTTSSILSPSVFLALGPHEPAVTSLFSSTAQEVLRLQGHPSQSPDEAAGFWGAPQG